jgi:hypothetical protein
MRIFLLKSLAPISVVFGVRTHFFADRLMIHPQASPPWTTEIFQQGLPSNLAQRCHTG